MAIKITDVCINCGACESECPNGAIYPSGENWTIADRTGIKDTYQLMSGHSIEPNALQPPVSNNYFFIVTDKCTECKGFHYEPQCALACPVDCCVPDLDNQETTESLFAKKAKLHLE